jgi:hypothetical protein
MESTAIFPPGNFLVKFLNSIMGFTSYLIFISQIADFTLPRKEAFLQMIRPEDCEKRVFLVGLSSL